MKKIFKYQGPALLWALFILVVCSISFGKVGQSHLFFVGFDKVTHCGLFFVLAIFISQGLVRQYGQRHFTLLPALAVFMIAVLFGALIEVLQLYIFTWRSGEWPDLACDIIGTCMGIFSILVTLYAANNNAKV